MVIVSSASHCSCAIIHVSRPKMTWVLPNIAIKMQHRSCVLSVFPILFPALSCTHIPWRDNTWHWAGSSSILLEVLVLTKNILWQRRESHQGCALEFKQCPQCLQAAGGDGPVHSFGLMGAVGTSSLCSKAPGRNCAGFLSAGEQSVPWEVCAIQGQHHKSMQFYYNLKEKELHWMTEILFLVDWLLIFCLLCLVVCHRRTSLVSESDFMQGCTLLYIWGLIWRNKLCYISMSRVFVNSQT